MNDPVVKNPSDRSVELAVIPLPQFITPPVDVPVTMPIPVVPYASVVAVVPVDQLAEVFTLKPVGRVAVPELPIPSKLCRTGVFTAFILCCPIPTFQLNSRTKIKVNEHALGNLLVKLLFIKDFKIVFPAEIMVVEFI
jgi:hypothetical protein